MNKPLSLSDLKAPDFVPVRAMEDVMAIRAEQIFVHGHTAETDASLPVRFFARELVSGARGIEEAEQFGRDLALIRRRVVKHAAMCLAMIDRIDLVMQQGQRA
jgi:hypothetical protein